MTSTNAPVDKSWIDNSNTRTSEYIRGIERFLDFAYACKSPNSKICCPCKKCKNRFFMSRNDVLSHCILNGFLGGYKNWVYHGESYVSVNATQDDDQLSGMEDRDEMVDMIHEAIGIGKHCQNINNQGDIPVVEDFSGADEVTRSFFKLLQDAECELYHGCKIFTKLSFIVRLLLLKVTNGWTDNSVTMVLEFLREVFPHAKIPASYYEAQKLVEELGFSYVTYDACPNSCMIFRGEDEKLDACLICETSRYKVGGRRIPAKQMRYFPLKQRLQKYFMSSKTAFLMKWHANERVDDGVFRHPADSLAWKEFDKKWSNFSYDSRNVRLGLATDGFNPFRTMSIAHSTWPVVLIPYNLPPWLCMTQQFFMLSVLIDGPKGPGNKIDVYLQPLIEELNELWRDGVQTYDASGNVMFQLHAALLWTISDFPAYSMLSGWSMKGEKACPCCHKDTDSYWLKHGRKFSYRGHRRYLPPSHRLRRDKVSFNGKVEYRSKPNRLSGSEIMQQLQYYSIVTEYKMDDLITRKQNQIHDWGSKEHNWKKKSIFFELEYWEHNLLCHNLDSMHIEKNNVDNILFTCMNLKKSKDNIYARRDLQDMGIRRPLHPQQQVVQGV